MMGNMKAMCSLAAEVVVVALAGAMVGCGGGTVGAGNLDVVVKDVSMAVVAGATVTTVPATKSLTTDTDGHARFTGLAAGDYTVTAANTDSGAAAARLSLKNGEARELTLILRKTGPAADAGGGTGGGAADGGAGGAAGGAVDASGDDDGGTSATTAIVLQALSQDTNGINLRWTATSPYASYRIYRGVDPGGAYAVIDVINDATAETYRDPTVMLGTSYHYRVGGLNAGSVEVESNSQTIAAGVFIDVGSQVQRMKADPQRPYLYALDMVNNSLHFINLTSNRVDKTIFVGSSPTDLDISLSGAELYVANSGSTEIAVVDLAMQAKSRSLLVAGTSSYPSPNPYHLAATAGDTLVYTGQSSGSSLILANALTGSTITSVYNSLGGAIVASPDGTHVYTGGYQLVRYDIVGTTMKQVDTAGNFNGSTTTLSRSGDGMYLFYGAQKVLATNLKSILGTFPESIQLANADGTIAIGGIRVYDGTAFTAKATLPLTTTVTAMSGDGKSLYLYSTTLSRIYLWKLP